MVSAVGVDAVMPFVVIAAAAVVAQSTSSDPSMQSLVPSHTDSSETHLASSAHLKCSCEEWHWDLSVAMVEVGVEAAAAVVVSGCASVAGGSTPPPQEQHASPAVGYPG